MFRCFFFGFAASALLFVAGPALAAPSFDSLDHNHDGHIKKEALYGHIYGYSRWDRNDNGMIERKEFEQSRFKNKKFSGWDANGDGEIDSKELYDDIFHEYDEDRNDRWTRREYDEAQDAGLFNKNRVIDPHDTDGSYSRTRTAVREPR